MAISEKVYSWWYSSVGSDYGSVVNYRPQAQKSPHTILYSYLTHDNANQVVTGAIEKVTIQVPIRTSTSAYPTVTSYFTLVDNSDDTGTIYTSDTNVVTTNKTTTVWQTIEMPADKCPPISLFNNQNFTTKVYQTVSASKEEDTYSPKDDRFIITVYYKPTSIYIRNDAGKLVEGIPYVYTGNGWVEGIAKVYDGTNYV